jgi:hypothetical protein
VDPTQPRTTLGRFETFDANARFVVVRDDDGYGVWRLEDLDDGEPIERFPDTDQGYEAAAVRWKEVTKQDRRRRTPWLTPMKWVVVVSAAAWALSSALSSILFLQVGASMFEGSGVFDTLVRWSQLVTVVATATTVGGIAVYVVLWLEARR